MNQAGAVYRFDDVAIYPAAFEVSKGGRVLTLEPKAIRVLVYLVENRQRAVGKEELLAAVWEDTAVTDNSLTRVIAQLRKGLGDNSKEPKYIATVPTLGYRFIAGVREPENAQAGEPALPPAPAPSRQPRWRWAAGAATVAALGAAWLAMRPASPPRLAHTVQLTTSQGLDAGVTFSPDASAIAYASDRSGWFEIFVRPTAVGGREIQITNDGKQNVQPAWSPDGKSVAYTSVGRRGILVAPALGGPPRQLTTFGSTPTWSPDSSLIAFRSEGVYSTSISDQMPSGTSTIWVVPAAGGAPRPVAAAQKVVARQTLPRFAPDGRLYFVAYDNLFSVGMWRCRTEGGEPTRLPLKPNTIHDYQITSGGQLFIASTGPEAAGAIWRSSEDGSAAAELLNTGQAQPGSLAVARDGSRIAWTSVRLNSNLWRLRLTPGGDPDGHPEAVTRDIDQRNSLPLLSPDGRQVAWYVHRLGMLGKVWVANADGSSAFPVSTGAGRDCPPNWMPGSESIILATNSEDRTEWRSIALADRSEKSLAAVPMRAYAPRVSPDGRSIAFFAIRDGVSNIWKADFGGGAVQITFDREGVGFPSWSPDGRWISMEVLRGDDTRLAVMPAAGGQALEVVSTPGKNWPHSWAPDSDRIAFAGFRSGQWQLYWVSRSTREERALTAIDASNGFLRYPSWSADGRLLVFERAASSGNIFLADLLR